MAEEDDDNMWILNLEAALLENSTATSIYNVCKGRNFPENIRSEAWQACLGVRDKENQIVKFDEIFDLPNQHTLRLDCQNFVEKLGNEENDKVSVVSDLESILTFYCKSKHLEYHPSSNWVDILLPIIALKRPLTETYNIFETIIDLYIPKTNNDIYNLLRLLILYHDPELCSFLDTKRITPDMFTKHWFQSLFSATCSLQCIQYMWDLYVQQAEPFFIFYLALVIILNGKDYIMTLKNEPKNVVIERLSDMPSGLGFEDVKDFCSLAQYYDMKTPGCFKKDLYDVLFGDSACSQSTLSQALCLPVTADEIVENAAENDLPSNIVQKVKFFLVDCRPAEQYNTGHLPTAFHLNCNLMLQEPTEFNTAVQGLLSSQKHSIAANSSAGGEHLCFLGSGRDEEDQYCHMVVASFLQKHIRYVSMVSGGYQAIHDYFGNDMSDCLEDHNPRLCLACSRDNLPSSPDNGEQDMVQPDLLGKISAVVKNKSADFKGKLFEYILTPSIASGGNERERHVSSKDKVGKLYRNMPPVFTIDNDNEQDVPYGEEEQNNSHEEVVKVSEYSKECGAVAKFPCYEVRVSGYMYESTLLVTDSRIVVLRHVKSGSDQGRVTVKRSFDTIVKITSKKKHPELITFKYGTADSDGLAISDMDRLLIPDASIATELISKQIMGYLQQKENASES